MIVELTKYIKVVRPEAKSIFPYSNSLLIDDEVKTMVDAGAGGNAYRPIVPEDIKLVLISHNHFDHVNGLAYFTNARVFAGKEEALTYSDPYAYYDFSGFKRWEEFMGEKKVGDMNSAIPMPDDIPVPIGFQPVKLAGVFKDGDTFNLGHTNLQIIHTPGHTPGHYSFYFPDESILFSGDIDISPRGPWYGSGYSDLNDLIESVNRLKILNPKILVTSHRRIFYDNIEQELQEFLNTALEKEKRILEYLQEPHTLNEIAAQDFAYEDEKRNRYTIFWAKMMIDKHLRRLEGMQKIRKTELEKYVRA